MEDDDYRLKPNDPYNKMDKMKGARDSIRPNFEGEGSDKNGLDQGKKTKSP